MRKRIASSIKLLTKSTKFKIKVSGARPQESLQNKKGSKVEKLSIQVEVTKEAHEVGEALAELLKNTKAALADGFQIGQDIPAIVMGSMEKLIKGVQGADQLGDEARADLEAFISGVLLGLKPGISAVVKKSA